MKLLCRKTLLFLVIGLALPIFVPAQTGSSTIELKAKLKRFEQQQGYLQDTAYANTLIRLGFLYANSYPDSALNILAGHAERCHASGYREGETDTYIIIGDAYQMKGLYEKALENYEKAFGLAKNIHYRKVLPLILNRIGIIHLNQGNNPEALSKFYESLKAAEAIEDKALIGATMNNIAIVHFYQGKFDEAEKDYQQLLKIAGEMADSSSMSLAYNGIGEVNLQQKNPAKALQNLAIAYQLATQVNNKEMQLTATLSMAEAYYESDSLQKAVTLFNNALLLSKQKDNGTYICNALIGLAKVRNRQGLLKEALANGLEALQRAEKMGQVQLIRDASEIVSSIYEARGDGINALKYYRVYKVNSDSLNNLASQRAVAIEKASYEFSKKEIAFQRKTLQQRWIIFSAFAAMFSLGVIVWITVRNKKRLNLTYKDLQQKNIVIESQKLKAEQTLVILEAAQSQLIQSEKMASLGELTAGIAHEIQNPLNFVNNFSEVSTELIDEMNEEISKGNIEDAQQIAQDLKQNLEKINHHGKRAGDIVKGMLQHSRNSSGIKEPTDVNKLTDEYLRLAVHGFRSKDNSFNASVNTHYDESLSADEAGIGRVNIIPQDIGRVILNLITNAFYAVTEKKKAPPSTEENSPDASREAKDYEPALTVTTRRMDPPQNGLEGGKVEITIADNGNGIPKKVLDKIFQPFFTTKPAGQGTGLGLSLSYDIVKAHGGEIKVKTKEGEGSEFIIVLPFV
jgi:signal transduction histidine kinase